MASIKWKNLIKNSITRPEKLDKLLTDDEISEINQVIQKYPMRINPYYLNLIRYRNDPIWKQCIPDINELIDIEGLEDPLCEERDSPVPGLTHRYPDRVLLLISSQCAMYCRFCTRKRKVGTEKLTISLSQILKGIKYIEEHTEVRDVILSGGDPLLLCDEKLDFILSRLRAIPHLEIIRIGTRVPCTLPQRITKNLCRVLRKYHPLYINTHFNHPWEITNESKKACEALADSGIPLGNQSVLLKGINDNPDIFKELNQKLLTIRVKPYYIFQADYVQGSNHFRTQAEVGLRIIENLRGHTSGLAVPHYVIDVPGGGGKISIIPNPIVDFTKDKILLRNYAGKIFEYTFPSNEKMAISQQITNIQKQKVSKKVTGEII
ncbi:MAG: KamA family radical SAM protein [Promethearchaeota archaeon]|nr:MAG: KamA family radical SAM protein [Candidatus Lokiarchaeota archaeon]